MMELNQYRLSKVSTKNRTQLLTTFDALLFFSPGLFILLMKIELPRPTESSDDIS